MRCALVLVLVLPLAGAFQLRGLVLAMFRNGRRRRIDRRSGEYRPGLHCNGMLHCSLVLECLPMPPGPSGTVRLCLLPKL